MVQTRASLPKTSNFGLFPFFVNIERSECLHIYGLGEKRAIMHQLEAPIHENKNPHPSPNAFALAITNKNNGKNGKKASIIG